MEAEQNGLGSLKPRVYASKNPRSNLNAAMQIKSYEPMGIKIQQHQQRMKSSKKSAEKQGRFQENTERNLQQHAHQLFASKLDMVLKIESPKPVQTSD
ncbi:MAG: hypothetical protein EZS28_040288, partial [Streblomastix strix]